MAAFRLHDASETGKIDDVKLVERLSRDYLFQLKQWENSDFMDLTANNYFELGAIKFITRLTTYAFKLKNKSLLQKSKILYDSLKKCYYLQRHPINMMKLSLAMLLNKY